ncbi:MAG: 3'-5' exonuclease [Bacteroidota bacterium]
MFNLKRDLIFFDIESTGLNVIRDRIVQIAMVKYFANGNEPEELVMLINPGIPISAEAMAVHGITPKDLANKPTFQQVADRLFEFVGNADLAGYNSNRFDVPLLMEEFARVGKELDMNNRRTVDVQRIFYKMEPRTLRAALRYYRGKEIENAHDALADVKATIEVLEGQLDKYKEVDLIDEDGNVTERPVKNDVQALHEFTTDLRFIDATQRLKYDHNGKVVFAFGKYNGQPVIDTFLKDKQYYNWMLNKDFSSQVKQYIKKLMKDYEREQRQQQ